MSPKPDPEMVFVVYSNTETVRKTLNSILRTGGIEPLLGPPAFAEAGADPRP